MTAPITVGTVDLTDEDIARAVGCLQRRELSPGRTTQEFERAVAARHQQPYATYCNSGQSALHLILEALKRQGDVYTVAVPALTYISSLHAVWNAGLQVKLVDVDPATYLMPWDAVPPCDVVMPVHLFGLPVPPPPSTYPNFRYIVEDACESLGAEGIGYGDAVAFSFYAAHTITTGVGGMVATKHEWLDNSVKRLCNHGRLRAHDLYAGTRINHLDTNVRFLFTDIGFSYKLGDVNAALGVGQLARLSENLAKRRQTARLITARLTPYPLQLPTQAGHTYMMYPIVCKEARVRDRLMAHLASHGIDSRHMMPITNQPIVRQMFGNIEGRFPVAQHINERGFYIGCHQHIGEEELSRIDEAFQAFFGVHT